MDAGLLETATDRDELATARTEIEALRAHVAHLEKEMAKPHFVKDYKAFVLHLLATLPLAEAMSGAVGGQYDEAGALLAENMQRIGLQDGMSIVDLGCGSGRLAKHLGLRMPNLDYLGIDIVEELLDYAATQSPPSFRFTLNHTLKIPAPDESADFVCAFSVFTHLLHQESYCYIQEAYRVLKPGGKLVFTFLESAHNWPIFQGMVNRAARGDRDDQLNMFTERPQLEAWAARLNMHVLGYDFGTPHDGAGQTMTIFQKPA